MAHLLTADRGDAGERLDLVLRRHLTKFAGATRSRVQRWIAEGRVMVNGQLVTRAAARVATGDAIALASADLPVRKLPQAEEMPLSVLYEDTDLLIVNKPPGLVVHPAYRHASGTLLNAVLWHARNWPATARPSIVGRLDRLTSGLVLIAKSRPIHAALQRTLATPDSEKIYLAVVHGRVSPTCGDIDLALARADHDRRRVTVSRERGAPSLTRYVRLSHAGGVSLVRCQLVTGRLHQIRVHLLARGWPIVGDPVYGISDPAITFDRQALHAWYTAFAHPVTRARIEVEAPLPSDIRDLMARTGLTLPTQAKLT